MAVRSDILWGPERVLAGGIGTFVLLVPNDYTFLVKSVVVNGAGLFGVDWNIQLVRQGFDETCVLARGNDLGVNAIARFDTWWALDPDCSLLLVVENVAGAVVTAGFGARLQGVAI